MDDDIANDLRHVEVEYIKYSVSCGYIFQSIKKA